MVKGSSLLARHPRDVAKLNLKTAHSEAKLALILAAVLHKVAWECQQLLAIVLGHALR